jgi:hypothetical protein
MRVLMWYVHAAQPGQRLSPSQCWMSDLSIDLSFVTDQGRVVGKGVLFPCNGRALEGFAALHFLILLIVVIKLLVFLLEPGLDL